MTAGTRGYRYVLTVIDHYSRFVKLYPLKTKHTHTHTLSWRAWSSTYGLRNAPVCGPRQRIGVCVAAVPGPLQETSDPHASHDSISPQGEQHHGEAPFLSQNCLGYPVCRVPTQMATVSGVLPDSVKPCSPFFNGRPTILRLLWTSCPSSSGLPSTQYCRGLRRTGGGPGGDQTDPPQTDPTVQGSGEQTEN